MNLPAISAPPSAKMWAQLGSFGSTLAKSEDVLLAALKEQIVSPNGYARIIDLVGGPDQPVTRTTWRRSLEAIEISPNLTEVRRHLAVLEDVCGAAPDLKRSKAMIAMLLDGFPAGRPANFAGYADTILHDVLDMGFSLHVVALACQQVRRHEKFLPTVAVVVEACREASAEWGGRLAMAKSLADRMERAHKIAALPEPEPTPWEIREERAYRATNSPSPEIRLAA